MPPRGGRQGGHCRPGRRIKLQRIGARVNAAPMIVVRSFSFRTGLRQLMEPAMRIDAVRVDGLRLRIPPKQQGSQQTGSQPGAPRRGARRGKAR